MENYNYILGFLSAGLFFSMLLFASIGIAIRLLFDAQKRDQNSANTPKKFSILFLLRDNWKTILATFLTVLVTLRFLPSAFPGQFSGGDLANPEGIEKWLAGSLFVGVIYNHLWQILKKRAEILKVKR